MCRQTPTLAQQIAATLTTSTTPRWRLAADIGVSPYTLRRWATGESSPRLQHLPRLAEVLGLDLAAVLTPQHSPD